MQGPSFERLYSEHATALLRFLILRTGDRGTAEDVLADTFERVLRSRRPFDPRKASEKTWLYTIALNLLRDQARRRGAETRALERVPAEHGPEDGGYDSVDTSGDLQRALALLPEEQREVVTLRFGAGLTLPEIAKVRGDPRTTVEGQFYRALKALRGHLA